MTSLPNEQLAASFVSLFFSFKGRINRARFWIGTIPLVVGWSAAMALLNWMFMPAKSLLPVYGFGIAAGVMLLWGQLGGFTKRLHDRGKSGWWLLVFFALPAAVSQAGEASTDFNLRIAEAVAIGANEAIHGPAKPAFQVRRTHQPRQILDRDCGHFRFLAGGLRDH
jgi:uncharacterized membrane protein YhaH (DUF805 family)